MNSWNNIDPKKEAFGRVTPLAYGGKQFSGAIIGAKQKNKKDMTQRGIRHWIGVILCAELLVLPAAGWGFHAHREINEKAIFLLPPALFSFYRKHLTFIREESIKPDARSRVVEGEACRHYIDLEQYWASGQLPYYWSGARKKYIAPFLEAHGTLPWHIVLMKGWLTQAFKDRDIPRILRLSADLGHYVADAHVPLHTTANHNGQWTGQQGIHGLWESRLPELFTENFDFVFDEKAVYIQSVQKKIWEIVYHTHRLSYVVLSIERALDRKYPFWAKYAYEGRGTTMRHVYTQEYALAYHLSLKRMVEKQMRASIHTVASIWLTAWIDAGCPPLT